MAYDERQSVRSLTPPRSDAYQDGPGSRLNGHPYQRRSSIIDENERDDNDYEDRVNADIGRVSDRPPPNPEDQYKSALQHRFPSRPKNDYVYTKPPNRFQPPSIPATSTTQPPPVPPLPSTAPITNPRSGAYQSTSRPTISGTNTPSTADGRVFPMPNLRRVDPDQQNTYARRVLNETSPTTTSPPIINPSQQRPITPGPNVRINNQNITRNTPTTSTTIPQSVVPGPHESIFEKISPHAGAVSYLGIGTFSQFEHCLRECLERERRHTGIASQIIRHDIPPTMSTYNYTHDSFLPPPTNPMISSSIDQQLINYPLTPYSTFGLDDIRQINVALSKSGISLFPYERPFFHSYPLPISLPTTTTIHSSYPYDRHTTGEVVSACQFVEEDSSLLLNQNRCQAVQNVWNALQHHEPYSYIDPLKSNISPIRPYNF